MAPLELNLEPKVRGKIKFPERTVGGRLESRLFVALE